MGKHRPLIITILVIVALFIIAFFPGLASYIAGGLFGIIMIIAIVMFFMWVDKWWTSRR